MCELVELPRSSFYAFVNHQPSARDLADEALLATSREIYERSRGTYGVPRVYGQLRRTGHRVARSRVARLMRANDLLDIDLHRQRLRDELAGLNSDIQVGAELINFILDLLAKPSGLYEKLTDSGRRQLNQAVFNKIYIHRHQVVADDINEPFRQIVHMEREARRLGREDCRRRIRHEAPETETPGSPSSEDGQAGSLSKSARR